MIVDCVQRVGEVDHADHGNGFAFPDLNLDRNRLFPYSHVPSRCHAYQKAAPYQKVAVNVDPPGIHHGHVRDMSIGSEEVDPVIRDTETHGKILNYEIHGVEDMVAENNFHAQVVC